jgi:hypothetical protein
MHIKTPFFIALTLVTFISNDSFAQSTNAGKDKNSIGISAMGLGMFTWGGELTYERYITNKLKASVHGFLGPGYSPGFRLALAYDVLEFKNHSYISLGVGYGNVWPQGRDGNNELVRERYEFAEAYLSYTYPVSKKWSVFFQISTSYDLNIETTIPNSTQTESRGPFLNYMMIGAKKSF